MTHETFEAIAALDALGAASGDELRALYEHLESCGDCRRAHEELQEAATLLARDLDPVAPPPEVRDRVFGALDESRTSGEVVDLDARRKRAPWWLVTAATLFLALWGWREIGIRVAREKVRSQTAEIEQLRQENDNLAREKEKLSGEMADLAAPATRAIALTGQQASPAASAKVFLEPDKRQALVFFHNLPANAGDHSYQLWIIRADQPTPQSAGVFDAAPDGSATIRIEQLPVATEIKALAVTLEQKGGAPQPSNTNFYVMGGV
jgi:anti-sigma-K factor RskA